MRRSIIALLAAIGMLALTALPSQAAINFKSGPTVTFSGYTATANAEMSGLGNVPATGQLTVNGYAIFTCKSPGGGNEAPGQNPVPATGASPVVDLGNSNHNGRGSISNLTATLVAPPTPTAKQAGCPNPNWTVGGGSLVLTSATLTIWQGSQTIYSQTFYP